MAASGYSHSSASIGDESANGNKTVKKEESTQVRAAVKSRVSLIITNDSANVVYVFKGPSAAINKGTRLNKEGGFLVIEDWQGEVTAAAATADSVVTYSEVF